MNNNLKQAREFCFQYLFHLQLPIFESLKQELAETKNSNSLADSISEFKTTTNALFSDEINLEIQERLFGIISNGPMLEEKISKNLKNWKMSRLSKVDFTILLLASYELCLENKNSKNIVINEAIELSKKFGALESSAFINGVLDSIAKNID